MTLRISPTYTSLKPEESQTPEGLSNYLMRAVFATGDSQRCSRDLGGFWFDISNPQISGLEGEFQMVVSPDNLNLLLRLRQGLNVYYNSSNTLWREIATFSLGSHSQRVFDGVRRMFELARTFELGDYTMRLERVDFSEPYKALDCYRIAHSL